MKYRKQHRSLLRGHYRQSALAALTNLGHMTPFLLLGPPHHLTIQWVREITSFVRVASAFCLVSSQK